MSLLLIVTTCIVLLSIYKIIKMPMFSDTPSLFVSHQSNTMSQHDYEIITVYKPSANYIKYYITTTITNASETFYQANTISPWAYIKNPWVRAEASPWAYIKGPQVYAETSPWAYCEVHLCAYNEASPWLSNNREYWKNKKVNVCVYKKTSPRLTNSEDRWIYEEDSSMIIYFSDVMRLSSCTLLLDYGSMRLFKTELPFEHASMIHLQSRILTTKEHNYDIQFARICYFVHKQQAYIHLLIWLICFLPIIYVKLSFRFQNICRSKKQHIKPSCYIDRKYSYQNNKVSSVSQIPTIGGGPPKFEFEYNQLVDNILLSNKTPENKHTVYTFFAYCTLSEANSMVEKDTGLVVCRTDISTITPCLNYSQAKLVAQCHNIHTKKNSSLLSIVSLLQAHNCKVSCYDKVLVFTPKLNKFKVKEITRHLINTDTESIVYDANELFPPLPPSNNDIEKIVQGFCAATHPSLFMEAGCAVCGLLCQVKDLTLLTDVNVSLDPLIVPGITRQERANDVHEIKEIPGPVLDRDCRHACKQCLDSLKKGKMPKMSLANGLWIGKVPKELQDLKYAETLLIARVRHNQCIVKVKASGRYKMRANAIVFENPIPKVYNVLPPPREELEQILAFMFTGPCRPTKEDLKRTPLLVRRNKVANALQWLVLNHSDYEGVEISKDNLNQYALEGIPVVVDYRESILNKETEEFSLHDTEGDDGFDGDCSFVVHGLYGEEYTTMTTDALKAIALEHLTQNNKILFVGHSKEPLTIFRNPQLFPSMMPWLFPYGLGGICNSKHNGRTSTREFKKHLLMYHDKRFQTDKNFALIAWNQEQIGDGATAGYLTANKARFPEIVDRLTNLDTEVLGELTTRLKKGSKTQPKNEKEEACYKLLKDLDLAGAKVSGSVGSKKHLRNQIWSLISYIGAPSWFITLSPADVKHPICLYYADTK